jgi:Fe-S-cluster-containing hydrogenase component 2
MSKKLLIDLLKLRETENITTDAVFRKGNYFGSFKTIRELASFQYTCRKCENAPCINACPAEALEKDENGVVSRAVNLCIRCKSCIVICPFGTLMNDLFEVKTSGYRFYELNDEEELKKFASAFPKDVVSVVDMDENPEENIYKLNDKILIKEKTWS